MRYTTITTKIPEELTVYIENIYRPMLPIFFIIAVISIIAMWKIFEKADVEGWKSLIPFYNSYAYVKIATGNGWLFLLILIPFVNIIFLIWFYIQLAKAFGLPGLFAVGLILVNTIFVMVLGFGNSEYIGPKGIAKKQGLLDEAQ